MERKMERYVRLFPWFSGLKNDLLFYIAVDTLFLTVVKGFTAVQIVSLNSISQIVCIVLQMPVLFFIRRLGNSSCVKISGLFMLLSALLTTFGTRFGVIVAARIIHDLSAMFNNASVVALENNLTALGRRSEFVRVRTRANMIYSALTMLISFVAGAMFNWNPYLPMAGCITTCTAGFVLSLFMADRSGLDKAAPQKYRREKLSGYGGLIVLAVVVYSFFSTLVQSGQNEGKLFIQQQVLAEHSVEETSLIIGTVVCVSRVARVCANALFARLYEKYRLKVGIALPTLMCIAIGCLLFGSLLPTMLPKVTVMGMGYIIILFARDPFTLYIQDVVFANTPAQQHQTVLALLGLGTKCSSAAVGLGLAAVLLCWPMSMVITILFVFSVIVIALSLWLYRLATQARAARRMA